MTADVAELLAKMTRLEYCLRTIRELLKEKILPDIDIRVEFHRLLGEVDTQLAILED